MERDELFLTYEKEVAEFKLGLIVTTALLPSQNQGHKSGQNHRIESSHL
jgi:hypothetical protein